VVEAVLDGAEAGARRAHLVDGGVDRGDRARAGQRRPAVAEVGQLTAELARINTNTTFNGLDVMQGTFTFQVGANKNESIGLSITQLSFSSISAGDISTIDTALASVSANRSTLGAVQNRLEHAINNLGVFQENISSAESRIRDVDVAAEMVNQTKLNILTQSGTAMLAQANQGAQGVLSLLRG